MLRVTLSWCTRRTVIRSLFFWFLFLHVDLSCDTINVAYGAIVLPPASDIRIRNAKDNCRLRRSKKLFSATCVRTIRRNEIIVRIITTRRRICVYVRTVSQRIATRKGRPRGPVARSTKSKSGHRSAV